MSARKLGLRSMLLVGCLLLPAVAQQPDRTVGGEPSRGTRSLSTSSKSFLREAAQGDLAEVDLAKLAGSKSSNPQVKQFAARMIRDHSANEDQVKALAAQESVTLPTTPNEKQQLEKRKLEGLSGKQFDGQYASMMLSDHEHDVSKFKPVAHNARNASVKEYAQKTLPVLESHLRAARELNSTMNARAGSSKTTQSAAAK